MPRSLKALYYVAAGPVMRLNGWRVRRFGRPSKSPARVHLGPGQKNYLEGWVNIDANRFTARVDIWANIADGIPLPDNCADAIYSHHVIEHLPDLPFHFREMMRVLKPGGCIRVGGPNGDAAMRKYVEGDLKWFSDFPDKRTSIGGRLENFIYVRQEHLTILTPSYLEELTSGVGLQDFRVVQPCRETNYPGHFDAAVLALEYEDTPECPHTLLIEARKPGAT